MLRHEIFRDHSSRCSEAILGQKQSRSSYMACSQFLPVYIWTVGRTPGGMTNAWYEGVYRVYRIPYVSSLQVI